jgi:hypothetical protein
VAERVGKYDDWDFRIWHDWDFRIWHDWDFRAKHSFRQSRDSRTCDSHGPAGRLG